jgi:UDPglucose--hexose-1-phosphate uridylyltransferase
MKKESELRYDLLTDDWVIIAPQRRNKSKASETCPFCDLKAQKKPVLIFNKGKKVNDLKEWTTVVFPNKYPVFYPDTRAKEEKENRFRLKIKSGGFHEVVVTREHNKPFAHLSTERIKEVISCYQERYIELNKHDFVKYILIFQNHGKEAGASQEHPHSQILTSPLIDKEFKNILSISQRYFRENKQCLQCKVNQMEKRNKKRIVFENEDFIAFCPFAPKFLFQVIVSPKKHSACFEIISEKERKNLAEAFKEILSRYEAVLNKPAYNFYLHTAPCNESECFSYFHWYWNFFPRLSKVAGFEMGANMEILTISPEEQAALLRKKKHV